MNLEAWLKQDHALADQLKVMEGLCSALNDAHQGGTLHRGLEPARIEVDSGDGSCDLSATVPSGASNPKYRAPELQEGATHSPQADIYAAGVIFYEMLSGRSPSADRPTPLSDLRPDVPRDLTDAVMGCLEKGPDWRPKDLSYLLQVVRTLRTQSGGKGARAARSSEPPRVANRPAVTSRRAAKSESSGNLPMFIAAGLVLVGAAVGAWFWMNGSSSKGGSATAAIRPTPPPPAPTTTLPAAAPSPSPSIAPVVAPSARPTPSLAPSVAPTVAPVVVPTTAPAAPVTRPTPPPPTTQPARVETVVREPEPRPTPAATPAPSTAPVQAEPAEPALLTAVSPLQVKRGVTTILDVRGSGLRPDHKAVVTKIKERPDGINVVRQKFVSSGLVQVILKLEETAIPGAYGLALTDASGAYSNTLSFTIAK